MGSARQCASSLRVYYTSVLLALVVCMAFIRAAVFRPYCLRKTLRVRRVDTIAPPSSKLN